MSDPSNFQVPNLNLVKIMNPASVMTGYLIFHNFCSTHSALKLLRISLFAKATMDFGLRLCEPNLLEWITDVSRR